MNVVAALDDFITLNGIAADELNEYYRLNEEEEEGEE